MSDRGDERSGRPATERAEEMLDSLGERMGRFLSRAMRSAEGLTGADAPVGDTAVGDTAGSPLAPAAATQRAERLLDGMGERVGRLAAQAGRQIRRAAALAREEAEDLWAEAQEVRSASRRSAD